MGDRVLLFDGSVACGSTIRLVGVVVGTSPGSAIIRAKSNVRLCVVDKHTYHSSDPVYGPNARYILSADHAVILIPRDPLTGGSYSVRIRQPGTPDIHWTFSADAPPSVGP